MFLSEKVDSAIYTTFVKITQKIVYRNREASIKNVNTVKIVLKKHRLDQTASQTSVKFFSSAVYNPFW